MNALDLYCCAGGATRGLQQAGVHVVGVDIKSQPRYCGDEFIRRDVLALKPEFLNAFDFIWASPPCQALSEMKVLHNAKPHLNLIPQTRALLIAGGKPFCIENVRGARSHLINPFMLCGTSFGLGARGRELKRHRLFETNFPVVAPTCRHSGRKVLGIYGGHVRDRQRDAGKNHRSGSNLPISVGREAMEIDWMSGAELSEAIPPAYSRFIRRGVLERSNQLFGRTRCRNQCSLTMMSGVPF
jgi:DNA (cytosine-5)-methyltransferase 1